PRRFGGSALRRGHGRTRRRLRRVLRGRRGRILDGAGIGRAGFGRQRPGAVLAGVPAAAGEALRRGGGCLPAVRRGVSVERSRGQRAILARRDALCQATVRRGVARVPEGDRRLSALGQAGGFVAEDRLLQLRAEALERRACGARARDARVSGHDRGAARGHAPRAPRAGGGLSVVAASPGELRSSDAAARVKVTEIFHSIQGEALFAGWPTIFVRLTGCPLRCRYCDSTYAFGGGTWWTIDEIVRHASTLGARHVCVTGGEPLAQPRCPVLLEALCDAGYIVCLETGGAHDISVVDPRVSRIVDIKTPGSGECARNRLENLPLLNSNDA